MGGVVRFAILISVDVVQRDIIRRQDRHVKLHLPLVYQVSPQFERIALNCLVRHSSGEPL